MVQYGPLCSQTRQLRTIGARLDRWTVEMMRAAEALNEIPEDIRSKAVALQKVQSFVESMKAAITELREGDLAHIRLAVAKIHVLAAWNADVANAFDVRVLSHIKTSSQDPATGASIPFEWLGDVDGTILAEALKISKSTVESHNKLGVTAGAGAGPSTALINSPANLADAKSISSVRHVLGRTPAKAAARTEGRGRRRRWRRRRAWPERISHHWEEPVEGTEGARPPEDSQSRARRGRK